jgi:lambda family phage portal protein
MRVAANEISHIYIQEYPEQIRGIPWISAVMTRLNVLKKYIEFALTASAVGASTMGFFTSPDGTLDALADGEDEETGELYSQAIPGEFGLLPPGYDFKSFNPNYPHTMFNDFVKGINRSIASGLSVSYNLLANDLEGVSYSSIRSSVLDERSHWESLQNSFINQLMEPIYKNWLQNALLKNLLISSDGQRLPANKIDKFSHHKFLARRWAWVDPRNDAEAKVVLIRNKLNSPYAVASEMGLDLDAILDDLQRFEIECKKRDLDPSTVLGNIEQNLKNNTEDEKVALEEDSVSTAA